MHNLKEFMVEKFNFPTDSAHMRVCDLWRSFLVFCDLYNCIHILRTIACVVVFALFIFSRFRLKTSYP